MTSSIPLSRNRRPSGPISTSYVAVEAGQAFVPSKVIDVEDGSCIGQVSDLSFLCVQHYSLLTVETWWEYLSGEQLGLGSTSIRSPAIRPFLSPVPSIRTHRHIESQQAIATRLHDRDLRSSQVLDPPLITVAESTPPPFHLPRSSPPPPFVVSALNTNATRHLG